MDWYDNDGNEANYEWKHWWENAQRQRQRHRQRHDEQLAEYTIEGERLRQWQAKGQKSRKEKRWERLVSIKSSGKKAREHFCAQYSHKCHPTCSRNRETMKALLRQISGLDKTGLGLLLRCGRGDPGVYIFDVHSRSARPPKRGELSWDVEFLLRHHRKHIFTAAWPLLIYAISSLGDKR